MFRKLSESRKNIRLEKMTDVERAQALIRETGGGRGSVKDRLRRVQRQLGWSHNRCKDVWYADPRIALSIDEWETLQRCRRQARRERVVGHDFQSFMARLARLEARLVAADADRACEDLAALRGMVR